MRAFLKLSGAGPGGGCSGARCGVRRSGCSDLCQRDRELGSERLGQLEPTAAFGGVFIINTSPETDATGELPFNNSTIEFDLLSDGTTSYRTSPLQGLAITQPTTRS